MNGRRIYHARGKVLGGSSSHQRDDLPARQPAGLRAVGVRSGHGDLGLRALPARTSSGWRRASRARTNGAATTARSCSSAARRRARSSTRSSRPCQQAGYPLTDDVNGYRQEGFARFDRNIHRGRRLSAARAYLHPVHGPPEPRGALHARMVTRILFDGTRAVGVEYDRRGAARSRRGGEVILCGGAINSPQLLQLSGVGNAAELEALGVDVVHDLPGVGENLQDHLEVYVQYALHAAGLDAAGAADGGTPVDRVPVALPAARAWRHEPLRGRRLRPLATTRSPTRTSCSTSCRSRSATTARNPSGGHGYQVHVGPMYSDARGSVKITSTDPAAKPALRFNYLSTEQDRREWVEAIRVRARHPRPAGASSRSTAARSLPGPDVRDRRGDPRLGARATPRRRCTRRARAGWGRTSWRSSTRRRCACTASTGCASSMRRCSPT